MLINWTGRFHFQLLMKSLFTISENDYCHGWLLQLYKGGRKTGQQGAIQKRTNTALDLIVLSWSGSILSCWYNSVGRNAATWLGNYHWSWSQVSLVQEVFFSSAAGCFGVGRRPTNLWPKSEVASGRKPRMKVPGTQDRSQVIIYFLPSHKEARSHYATKIS